MRDVRTRSMQDIGVGVPIVMPRSIADDLAPAVFEHASITRGEGLRHVRREIARNREATLPVILTVLKVLAIPRTEEMLAHTTKMGMKPECGPGCNACCYQSVEVSIPEAILVALQVADPADPRYTAVLKSSEATVNLGTYSSRQFPCPLLVDGKCSIYENRPLLCRATLSPCAKSCYEALDGKDAIQIYWGPQFFALGDKDAMRGICKDLNLQYDTVELVHAVASILRDPTIVVRWAAGEHVFTPLRKDGLPKAIG